jgi:predicted  nucleic acid-binding Zn-ribbon protein
VRADPFAQLKLLDVQELDSRLDVLRHHAMNPPEAAELAEQAATREKLDGRARDLRVVVADLTRAQRKADADVEAVRTRRTRDQQRLDSGAMASPKDLERLQHELVSLDRRIGVLEDEELEVMEQLEAAQTDLAAVESQLAALDARVQELIAAREQRVEGLREEAREVRRQRDTVVGDLPADLLELYDRLRAQKGGVGAALLRAGRCEGCRMDLNRADLAQIAAKPSDEVVRCEECSRILVRTGESGL